MKALESQGLVQRINFEHWLCTLLEEAMQRAELDARRPDDDPVVLGLRAALAAHLREKSFQKELDAREQLETHMADERAQMAMRCCAAELQLAKLKGKG